MERTVLFHGSDTEVEFPEIRKTRFTKDFSWGFYCTNNLVQAVRWASRRNQEGVVSKYIFIPDPGLKILHFEKMTDEWLDFIAQCRSGIVHNYDIVEGPMADDTIWNYVNDFLAGEITRNLFWEYARFRHPTHQISFHTIKALNCLEFQGGMRVYGGKVKE